MLQGFYYLSIIYNHFCPRKEVKRIAGKNVLYVYIVKKWFQPFYLLDLGLIVWPFHSRTSKITRETHSIDFFRLRVNRHTFQVTRTKRRMKREMKEWLREIQIIRYRYDKDNKDLITSILFSLIISSNPYYHSHFPSFLSAGENGL